MLRELRDQLEALLKPTKSSKNIYSSGLARSTRRYRVPLQTLREMIGYANYLPTSQHFGVFLLLGLPVGLLDPLQTLREMKGYGLDPAADPPHRPPRTAPVPPGSYCLRPSVYPRLSTSATARWSHLDTVRVPLHASPKKTAGQGRVGFCFRMSSLD